MKKVTVVFLTLLALFQGAYMLYNRNSPRRVIFVSIDTLRADHLQSFGYPRNTAPFIETLIEQGTVFESAYSQIPHTSPSHTSMFTGLYPFQHGLLRNHEVLSEDIPNLHKQLNAAGLANAAFPSVRFLDGKVSFPPSPVELQLGKSGRETPAWYLSAAEVVSNALAWFKSDIETGSGDYFAWLHFYDVHEWSGWLNLPPEYRHAARADPCEDLISFVQEEHKIPMDFWKSKKHLRKALQRYDARVRYVDDELKRLRDELEKRDLLRGSIWVITSDHGEGLGDHNYKGHGEFLYQEQLHVPLIIWAEDGHLGSKRFSQMVRLVDLYPTLAELCDAPLTDELKMRIEGKSLLPLMRGETSKVTELSFAERRPKDMVSFRRDWEEGELRSLHTQALKIIQKRTLDELLYDQFFDFHMDPHELESLQSHADGAWLRDQLDLILDKPAGARANAEPELDEDQMEELRSLGYF